ncbi:hypothetical protein Tco_0850397 [Tanacetum coccineum]
METQAINDQDHLVNNDNDNENDDLGYRSEINFDEGDEEDENNNLNGNVVKRGITRLKILSLKKVDSEARDKLWDEIMRYFDVDLTVRKLVASDDLRDALSVIFGLSELKVLFLELNRFGILLDEREEGQIDLQEKFWEFSDYWDIMQSFLVWLLFHYLGYKNLTSSGYIPFGFYTGYEA